MGGTDLKADAGSGGVWAPGWWLYRFAMGVLLILAGPVLLVRRRRHYLPTLRRRLGLGRGEAGARRGGLWIHAVSVGEVAVAATLARGLPDDEPTLVTTVTPTGQERARAAFRDRSRVDYLPFDLAGPVRRLFDRHAPGALVLVEGDYWPLVLHETVRRRLPVAVVNGRVGDRSFRRMESLRSLPGSLGRLGRRLLGLLFDAVDRFGVQTEEDRRRLLTLGIDPARVRVTGNLKYDTPTPTTHPDLERTVRRLAGDRPILLAGSTMAGEDGRVLEAFSRCGAGARALLVLAPRHPERWEAVAAEVAGAGFSLARRSTLDLTSPTPEDAGPSRPDVLLLDSLGELAGLYRIAAAAFIGGTLAPTGGHNPLEAACWATPVTVGPSMENFRQIAEEFDRHEAWRRVSDGGELAAVWARWLDDPDEARRIGERGKRLIESNRGALPRTLEMLSDLGLDQERGD